MKLMDNILIIWKNKNQILEGIKNNIFRREDIEHVAAQRMHICQQCPTELYSFQDDGGCILPGSAPCCDQRLGGCGCSLALKTRSLSSSCPKDHWKALLTQEEEDMLNSKLGITDGSK